MAMSAIFSSSASGTIGAGLRRPYPGIGAGVAVENGLVVLRGRQREGRFPVAERQQRHFLAHQKFFDDHTASGRAEHAAHDLVERFERLFLGLGHDDALARRKAVRLDDDGRALFFHKGLGGFQFGEHAAGGGRDTRFLHDVLGESFAPSSCAHHWLGPKQRMPA